MTEEDGPMQKEAESAPAGNGYIDIAEADPTVPEAGDEAPPPRAIIVWIDSLDPPVARVTTQGVPQIYVAAFLRVAARDADRRVMEG
jgi:hypothetical protein